MSRFVAVAAALALVISGVLVGALGTYLILERPGRREMAWPPGPPGFPPHPRPFSRELELRLEMTEPQMRQFHDIVRESREQAEAIRRELRPRLDAHLAETRKRIAGMLTPAQLAKLEAIMDEDPRRADRFLLDGPPPPPPGGPPPFGGPPPR